MVGKNKEQLAPRALQQELVESMEMFSHRHTNIENGGWNKGITIGSVFSDEQLASVSGLYGTFEKTAPSQIVVAQHLAAPQEGRYVDQSIMYIKEIYEETSVLCGGILLRGKLRHKGIEDFIHERHALESILAEDESRSLTSRFTRLMGIGPRQRYSVTIARANFLLQVLEQAYSIYDTGDGR